MSILRKLPVWLAVASYLFANTLASSWHQHGDCCHDGACHRADRELTQAAEHDGARHCNHHHHDQHHQHAQARHTSGHGVCEDHSPQHNGGGQHDPQHCVVCEFLALAPLAAPAVALEVSGDVLPEVVVADVVTVSSTTVETHLARGPPAA